jgi:hypothetical protein
MRHVTGLMLYCNIVRIMYFYQYDVKKVDAASFLEKATYCINVG